MARRRVAVLSDVHGCFTALQAVLAEIDSLGIPEVVVAGDIVNFGASSDRVVDLLRGRGARMVRGNHEIELVVPYHLVSTGQASPADAVALGAPPALFRGPRFAVARWVNEQLGPERRAFLGALPDQLLLDERTLVCHGSPRGARDGVNPDHTVDELRAKFGDHAATLVFVGHIHRPHIRVVPPLPGTSQPHRRFANAGSVGITLDGDPRASYVLAERTELAEKDALPGGEWRVEIRRVAYDTGAAVREYDNGLRDVAPEHVEAFCRQIRTGRHYFGPWVRLSQHLADDEIRPSLRRFLEENP